MTIQDVARQAGVSAATVSRVLTGSRPVGAEASRLVRDAARQLGYQPNHVASALRRRSTGTIGMIVPQISNPFFPQLVQAVEHALHDSGQGLLLCDGEEDPTVEAERVRNLLARQVDGLLIIPCDSERSAPVVRDATARVPVVQLDRVVSGPVTDSVTVDNHAGMSQLVGYLQGLGHTRLVFVGANSTNSTARERLSGYLAATQASRPVRPDDVLLGEFTSQWGSEAASRLSAGGPLPDAVVCANDLIALGVLAAFSTHGIQVPGDVAVSGYDDIDFATLSRPTLTTVRQPVQELAAEAVRALLSRLARPDGAPRTIRIPPSLMARESTAHRASPEADNAS